VHEITHDYSICHSTKHRDRQHSRVQQAFTIDMSSMEYIRALDKTLLHGALFKCLDHRGIPVTVKKNTTKSQNTG